MLILFYTVHIYCTLFALLVKVLRNFDKLLLLDITAFSLISLDKSFQILTPNILSDFLF